MSTFVARPTSLQVSTARTLAGLVCIALAACAPAGASPAPDRDEPPSRPPGTTRMRMQAHFEDLRAMERLILDGDLERVRERANEIVFDRGESELPAWAPYIARMREAAVALARAESMTEACRAETRLARECATCHEASGAMPTFVVPAAPADEPTLAARMARHQWATDRLWEGVVGLSDEAWQVGLGVLAAAPLPAAALSDKASESKRLGRYARELPRVARRGLPARTPAARATAYAELLVVCSGCHARLESEW